MILLVDIGVSEHQVRGRAAPVWMTGTSVIATFPLPIKVLLTGTQPFPRSLTAAHTDGIIIKITACHSHAHKKYYICFSLLWALSLCYRREPKIQQQKEEEERSTKYNRLQKNPCIHALITPN